MAPSVESVHAETGLVPEQTVPMHLERKLSWPLLQLSPRCEGEVAGPLAPRVTARVQT